MAAGNKKSPGRANGQGQKDTLRKRIIPQSDGLSIAATILFQIQRLSCRDQLRPACWDKFERALGKYYGVCQ